MTIGDRIKFFRNRRGLTQYMLGRLVGFSDSTAEIRISQYECGVRKPKEYMLYRIAYFLGVIPEALTVTGAEDYTNIMQMFFALEDLYGVKIDKNGNELVIRLDEKHEKHEAMCEMLSAWYNEVEKWRGGVIKKADYDEWRYNYSRDKP